MVSVLRFTSFIAIVWYHFISPPAVALVYSSVVLALLQKYGVCSCPAISAAANVSVASRISFSMYGVWPGFIICALISNKFNKKQGIWAPASPSAGD